MENYIKLSILGEGGSAKVYKAKKKNTGEMVALKRFKLEMIDPPIGIIPTAIREITFLIELKHPNIVR